MPWLGLCGSVDCYGLMVCRQWLPRGGATLYSCPCQLGHMPGGAGATKGVVEQGGSSGESGVVHMVLAS